MNQGEALCFYAVFELHLRSNSKNKIGSWIYLEIDAKYGRKVPDSETVHPRLLISKQAAR